jgi:uncharacterized protein YeaO (DUF488 family)
MAIRIVQLGSERMDGEGVRFGTVRRPPRGVPKERFSADDWYDVWLPILAPSDELRKQYMDTGTPQAWKAFTRKYRTAMADREPSQVLDVLAALSHSVNFSAGCYCEDESRCHRSILRELLHAHGAAIAE